MVPLMTPSDLDEDYELIDSCRICDSEDLHVILDLGVQPLANALRELGDSSEEKKFPLVLLRCRNCTSVQLSVNVNPKLMFQNYFWVTGTTETAREHCHRLAVELSKYLEDGQAVLEIGSNDGTLLREFLKLTSGEIYGIDPAVDIYQESGDSKIKVLTDFFTSKFASGFKNQFGQVDLVVARNVLSHVPDLKDVFAGIDLLLSPTGIFVVEFHEATKILSEIHYDSIYHEHTFYHSIKSMTEAQSKIGLIPFDVIQSPISGGSHVLVSSRIPKPPSKRLLEARKKEEASGVGSESAWMDFAKKSRENLAQIRDFLVRNQDVALIAFGASARSSTLINAVGTEAKRLTAIADNNPLKWNKLSPGSHLPIESPRSLITENVKVVFICPFNFEEEIVNYLQADLGWHGQVFLPLPDKPRVYTI
jgi:SAM-dependent methyltransferase